jgi:dolichyl-phosphate-mannose--protein O-mannosyl transferase
LQIDILLIATSQQSDLHVTVAALVVGLVIGVFGHITHSRLLILTGILIIGAVSAYFSFVLQPGG